MKRRGMKLPVNKIICGNCRDIMKGWKLPKDTVIITDPPYGIDYKKIQGSRPNEAEYEAIQGDETEMDLSFLLDKNELKIIFGLQNSWRQIPSKGTWLCWDKRYNPKHDKFDKLLGSAFELIWSSSDSGYYRIYRVAHGGWFNADSINYRGKRFHPTQKPVKLLLAIINDFTKQNSLILDPFCGSGTTCIAAKMLGRDYIGIDISEKYCEITRERLKHVVRGSRLGFFDKKPKKKKRSRLI